MRNENLPDLLSLSPAAADRTWRKWLADRDPMEGELGGLATNVGLAINEWRMNAGKEGEQKSRENLVTRILKFDTAYRQATNG